jgi:hypothetical protein
MAFGGLRDIRYDECNGFPLPIDGKIADEAVLSEVFSNRKSTRETH